MAIQQINIGQAPNDGTGDLLRDAFGKANANFADLDTRASAAWTRANEGVADAAAAQSTADGAASGVADARGAAFAAQATADAAGGAATAAQATADGAVTAAGDAQADATSALAQVATRAPIANPSFTGVAVAPDLVISKAAGANRRLLFRSDDLDRWGVESNGAAESGANAGSNLVARRYSDAGSSIDTPLLIDRATGRLAVGPGSTAVDANAALLVNGGVRAGSWFLPGAFTFATLPTPSGWLSGAITFCSDAADGPSDVQCNGTEWLSLKTGLPANLLQEVVVDAGRRSTRLPDGTLLAVGAINIDMTGVVFINGGSGSGYYLLGSVNHGAPFIASILPRGVVSFLDGQPGSRAAYMSYYELNALTIAGMYLVTPMWSAASMNGTGYINWTLRGRWKL